jgi:hypothetical protein
MNFRDKQILTAIVADLSNRQLLKDYRESVAHLNDVVEHRNTGSEWHLGKSIFGVLIEARVSLKLTIAELEKRGYDLTKIGNVPSLIELKSNQKIQAEREAKAAAIQAEKDKPSMFDLWYNKQITGLGSFDTALFELYLLAGNSNRDALAQAFPEKFKNVKFK